MRCRTMMDDIGFIGVSLAVINAPFLYSFAARMVVLLFLRTPTCHCNQPHEKFPSEIKRAAPSDLQPFGFESTCINFDCTTAPNIIALNLAPVRMWSNIPMQCEKLEETKSCTYYILTSSTQNRIVRSVLYTCKESQRVCTQ